MANSSAPTPQEPKQGSGQWWEVYIIRYFVGSVVGAAILLFLNRSETSALREFIMPGVVDISKLEPQLLILLGTMGLTYCYVASAPILVLHAARASMLPGQSPTLNRWLGWVVGIVLATVIGAVLANFANVTVLSSLALFLTLALQVVPLVIASLNRGEVGHAYYLKIAKARANTRPEREEYKESYRHLREHGNAFLILLFEAVLGIILAGAHSSFFALIALIIWILPASFVWLYGCILEYRYSQ